MPILLDIPTLSIVPPLGNTGSGESIHKFHPSILEATILAIGCHMFPLHDLYKLDKQSKAWVDFTHMELNDGKLISKEHEPTFKDYPS